MMLMMALFLVGRRWWWMKVMTRMRGGVFYEDERNEATRGDEEKYKTKRGREEQN